MQKILVTLLLCVGCAKTVSPHEVNSKSDDVQIKVTDLKPKKMKVNISNPIVSPVVNGFATWTFFQDGKSVSGAHKGTDGAVVGVGTVRDESGKYLIDSLIESNKAGCLLKPLKNDAYQEVPNETKLEGDWVFVERKQGAMIFRQSAKGLTFRLECGKVTLSSQGVELKKILTVSSEPSLSVSNLKQILGTHLNVFTKDIYQEPDAKFVRHVDEKRGFEFAYVGAYSKNDLFADLHDRAKTIVPEDCLKFHNWDFLPIQNEQKTSIDESIESLLTDSNPIKETLSREDVKLVLRGIQYGVHGGRHSYESAEFFWLLSLSSRQLLPDPLKVGDEQKIGMICYRSKNPT